MLARLLEVRSFRNLESAAVELGDSITVIHGPNGAGKTNLLEALCLGLTGASWRTRTDHELIRFDAELARAEVVVDDGVETRRFVASVERGEGRRQRLNGAPTRPDSALLRPAVTIFSPDRLSLVKGPPATRRRHLDRFIAALWPSRSELRRRYGLALAQRNALLGRIRSRAASADALAAWDVELATAAAALVHARGAAVERLAPAYRSLAASLGSAKEAALTYRPRTGTADVSEIAAQLRERRAADLDRGHSTHGPHLDELVLAVDGRPLRRVGSQGEQRVALLALLFAERAALLEARSTPPLLLLDDVMSELDADRRALLVDLLGEGGQALLSATEPSHVPDRTERTEIEMVEGRATAAIRAPA